MPLTDFVCPKTGSTVLPRFRYNLCPRFVSSFRSIRSLVERLAPRYLVWVMSLGKDPTTQGGLAHSGPPEGQDDQKRQGSPLPFRTATRHGAQVAPQRCPTLRLGINDYNLLMIKGKCS